MVDTTKMQAEQTQTKETPSIEAPTLEKNSNFDELKEVSQQFIRTLFRTGIQVAMTPLFILPEEPRKHFVSAGREFTRGLATLASELADGFEKVADEVKETVEKDAG